MEPTGVKITSTPKEKPKRNFVEQFLPFYKKSGEGEGSEDWMVKDKSSKKNNFSYSKPEPTPGKWQKKRRQSVDSSLITTEGATSPSNKSPRESKVTSTAVAAAKPSQDKHSKRNISEIQSNESTLDLSVELSKKNKKRNKSVSFLLEENNEAVVKRPRSDISNGTESDNTPQKEKSKKKNKMVSKENMEIDHNVEEPIPKKNKKKSNKSKHTLSKTTSEVEAVPQLKPLSNKNNEVMTDQSKETAVPDSGTKPDEIKEKKNKKRANKQRAKTDSAEGKDKADEPVVKKISKKSKHQVAPENGDDEPATKSPKNIASNLEKLSLGDNAHTLSNLINEMTVVDKAKKKKVRKEINKKNTNNNKNLASDDSNSKEIGKENPNESNDAEGEPEPKKWVKKRWNKKNKTDCEKKSLNIDNLPISLLKGNFKKVLIDHFSEFGLYRGVGEAYTVDDKVFSTKIHFDTTEAATKALERNGSTISGNEIRLSEVQPRPETTIVVRIYGPPEKLTTKDLLAAYKDIGIIRSIRVNSHSKKTMITAFVEFEGEDEVEAALEKSANLLINGASVKVDRFIFKTTVEKEKGKKKPRRKRRNKKDGKPSAVATVPSTNDDHSEADDDDDSD